MKTIQYFELSTIETIADLKKAYRELCKQYHPDHNPNIDEEVIKVVNAEYIILKQLFDTNRYNNYRQNVGQNTADGERHIDEIFVDMYLKVCHLPLDFELIGNWIWATGETFLYRKDLKEAGYFFAPKKKCWYWRPPDYKSTHSDKSLDEIRDTYGSTKFNSQKMKRKFLE